jgi:hypothetical protein
MLNVSLRITESGSNAPLPVRLRITTPDGRYFPPLGRVPQPATARGIDVGGNVVWQGSPWSYINGACEVPLPGGEQIIVEAVKGPEYVPIKQTIALGAGQMALRLSMQRWMDLRADGWYAGDTRCHYLSPHGALLEGQAEDLDVVQLLAFQENANSIPGMLAFSGQQACVEAPHCAVVVNTLNVHAVLGRLGLLHCHRPVFPLVFGSPYDSDDWSLADWCAQCHRKSGLVVWCNALEQRAEVSAEALADVVLGKVDAVEVTPSSASLAPLYDWWSAGVRAPIVGASGKDSNATILGCMRTLAHVPSVESYSNATWIEAVRAGRTVVTSGPIIELSVSGRPIGSTIEHTSDATPFKITAKVRSSTMPGPLEILVGGNVVARTADFGEMPHTAGLEIEASPKFSTWIAARCGGSPADAGFAHTSPVFVQVDGKPINDLALGQSIAKEIDRTIRWVETSGVFLLERRKAAILDVLRQAQEKLQS